MKISKMRDMSNEELFSLFTEYTKKMIKEDLKDICDKDACILDSDDPWAFYPGE